MGKDVRYVRYSFGLFLLGLSLLFGAFLAWNIKQDHKSMDNFIHNESVQNYLKYENSKKTEKSSIEVNKPFGAVAEQYESLIVNTLITHLSIYICILIFSIWGYNRLSKELRKKRDFQQLIIESEAKLQKQNKEFLQLNTEYKSQNDKLVLAIEKAKESDNLKSAFLHNLSHEIRTPLNAIIGFAALLDRPNLKDDKKSNFISLIVNSGNQLLAVLNDIFTISFLDSHQEHVRLEKIDIFEVITDLMKTYKRQAQENGILFQIQMPSTEYNLEVFTDKIKFTQIVSHLVVNALKFTKEGFIEIGCNIKTNELEFYVQDSGIGIPEDQLDVIFEKFRQLEHSLNRVYSGTGLGLAISKAFVDMLGGKIWVRSTPGNGSIFYFTIPFHKEYVEYDNSYTSQKNKKLS